MVYAPFRECVVLSLASFRKRGSSLSGDPCQRYVGGSVARGFIFLSVLLVFPTFSVLLLYSRQSILWRSKLRADPVLVFLLNGQSVLYDVVALTSCCVSSLSSGPRCLASWLVWTRRLGLLVVTLTLARCSSWCLWPQMPVIMAGLDHRTV